MHANRAAALACLVWALGCRSVPCEQQSPGDERDTCWFEQVSQQANAGQFQEAATLIARIESPLIRFAAIQRLTVHRYEGFDLKTLRGLCSGLPNDLRDKCTETCNRPHLW